MSKIVRSVIVAGFIFGGAIIEPNYFNLLNQRVYASEYKPTLEKIYLSEGNNIEFREDVHSYIVDIDKNTEVAYIKARPDDPSDKVTINNEVVSKDDNYKEFLYLNPGKNTVDIEVEDGRTKSTSKYTVYIYRGGKDAIYLKDININGQTIGFDKTSNFYNIELDEGDNIAELEMVPEDGNYSISVKGNKLADTNSIKLKLNGIGKYTIDVLVNDNDTERMGKYTLNLYYGIPVTPNVSEAINSVLKPNQWIIVNGRWRYNDTLGQPLKDTWFYDSKYKSYFHFTSRGNMQTGWIDVDGKVYYLNSNGEMQTGWQYYENEWYYLGQDGVMRTSWTEVDGKWYFLKKDGAMRTGWIFDNNKWYYLSTNLNSSGVMKTGWMYYGKKWYYFNPDGSMQTGWLQSGDDWYFLNSDGSMKYGAWLYYKWHWYYLNNAGIMWLGWFQDKDDKIYYFNEDGTMNTDAKTIDGYTYKFNDDGAVVL